MARIVQALAATPPSCGESAETLSCMEAPDDAVPVRVRLLAGGVDLALVLAVTGVIVAAVLKRTKDPLTERVQLFTKMMTTRRVRTSAGR